MKFSQVTLAGQSSRSEPGPIRLLSRTTSLVVEGEEREGWSTTTEKMNQTLRNSKRLRRAREQGRAEYSDLSEFSMHYISCACIASNARLKRAAAANVIVAAWAAEESPQNNGASVFDLQISVTVNRARHMPDRHKEPLRCSVLRLVLSCTVDRKI